MKNIKIKIWEGTPERGCHRNSKVSAQAGHHVKYHVVGTKQADPMEGRRSRKIILRCDADSIAYLNIITIEHPYIDIEKYTKS